MIAAVTGTPGAGKSYYALRKFCEGIEHGHYAATNVTLIPGWEDILARRNPLVRFSEKHRTRRARRYAACSHRCDDLAELMTVRLGCQQCGSRPTLDRTKPGRCENGHRLREARGQAVIDEAHEWLNNRQWDKEDRSDYVRFFSLHRKLGWDVFLITQHLDSIDKQIRDRVEFHVHLRNMKNMKIAGLPIFPFNGFVAIWEWYGGPKNIVHIAKREFFLLDSRKKLYDTYGLTGVTYDGAVGIWLPRLRETDPSVPPDADELDARSIVALAELQAAGGPSSPSRADGPGDVAPESS